ncbi:MAG: hypothetical protein AAFO58_03610 [Pseudomonadota bacterium]
MSFFRPEVVQGLTRWRWVLLGGAMAALGAWWVLTGRLYLPYLGFVLIGVGALLALDGWRRLRFPSGTGAGGPGVIEVDERRITYLTSEGGAALSIDGLTRVEVQTGRQGRLMWILRDAAGDQLYLPGDAQGADALFDALVALPGLNYAQAAEAAKAAGPDRFLIWQKDKRALH